MYIYVCICVYTRSCRQPSPFAHIFKSDLWNEISAAISPFSVKMHLLRTDVPPLGEVNIVLTSQEQNSGSNFPLFS